MRTYDYDSSRLRLHPTPAKAKLYTPSQPALNKYLHLPRRLLCAGCRAFAAAAAVYAGYRGGLVSVGVEPRLVDEDGELCFWRCGGNVVWGVCVGI